MQKALPSDGVCTLASVGDALLEQGIELLTAPRGQHVPVKNAELHDPQAQAAPTAGTVLLGIGVTDTAAALDFIRAARNQHATAVFIRDIPFTPELVKEAEAGGVAVCSLPPGMGWQTAHDLLSNAIATAPRATASSITAVRVGDLFALANAVASMVGGAVVIASPALEVLAYSSLDQPIDEARRGTILNRRPSPERLQRFEAAGVPQRVRTTEGVVRLEGYESEDMRNRFAIGVRAGRSQFLGSIWVTEGTRPLDSSAEATLQEAAAIASIHLLRHRALDDLDRQLRAQAVRGMLYGQETGTSHGPALDLRSSSALTVAAFAAPLEAESEPALKREYILDLVTFHSQMHARRSACVAVGDLVYSLLPSTADRDHLHRMALEVTDRAAHELGLALHAGIGSTVGRPSEVSRSREEAEQALAVLMSERSDRVVAGIEDVNAQVVLGVLGDWLEDHPEWRLEKLRRLIDHDAAHSTEFSRSLHAYLEHFGDVRSAAAQLHVHQNTLRYRLQRIGEMWGIDLQDPDERLVAALELRALRRD